jgi:murein L,D-transpeptidase YcbB/YkuD
MILRTFLFAILAAGSAAAVAQPVRMPIEPVDLPASVRSGVGLIHIDPETAPLPPPRDDLMDSLDVTETAGQPTDLLRPMSPLYTDLRRAMMRYRQRWSSLPQVQLPEVATLSQGAQGEPVRLLRQRLGLADGTRFDKALADVVRAYKSAHGLANNAVVDAATIESLNRGAEYYEQLILMNLDRARHLPADEHSKYILVDAGAARLWLYENGKAVDSMRAIVGSKAQATPMLAALIRYAEVNPYWNVPPDLVQRLIAPRVLEQGTAYLTERRYEVLSGWDENAVTVDSATIDWQAAANGSLELRVRQLPGANNSMGEIKFMMPNSYGIYLHDTPNKALFAEANRWISNGCVRVEDARRLASWLFGAMPEAKDRDRDEHVPLEQPVPVYITYLTAAPGAKGDVEFRADPYERDAPALARMFGPNPALETAARQ